MSAPHVNLKAIRRAIVAIVALTVVALGVPIFFYTTAIHRAELPTLEVATEALEFLNSVHFSIPVYLELPNSQEAFITKAQHLLDSRLAEEYPHLAGIWRLELHRATSSTASDDYRVKFEHLDKEDASEAFYILPFSRTTVLHTSHRVAIANKVDDFLVLILLDEVFGAELSQLGRLVKTGARAADHDVIVPYSSAYNLVFSLLVENGRSVEWDIEQALGLLRPVLSKLHHFANFSISSQIQYYSWLDHQPKYDDEKRAYVFAESELPTFINSGDWNLITHDIRPSINFLTYFAASNYENRPLVIENSDTNSFLVPQWGGVSIYNKGMPILRDSNVRIGTDELRPILEIFTSQLFELLGVPHGPKSLLIRVDAVSRITAFQNLKKALDNLVSLVKLTESLSEISIPELTKTHVQESLKYYHQAVDKVAGGDYYGAMTDSARSLERSDNAFFEKEMVQQAYFPSEHKLAVFLPLLGPVCTIVTLGLVKLVKDIKEERKEKETEEKEEEKEEKN